MNQLRVLEYLSLPASHKLCTIYWFIVRLFGSNVFCNSTITYYLRQENQNHVTWKYSLSWHCQRAYNGLVNNMFGCQGYSYIQGWPLTCITMICAAVDASVASILVANFRFSSSVWNSCNIFSEFRKTANMAFVGVCMHFDEECQRIPPKFHTDRSGIHWGHLICLYNSTKWSICNEQTNDSMTGCQVGFKAYPPISDIHQPHEGLSTIPICWLLLLHQWWLLKRIMHGC